MCSLIQFERKGNVFCRCQQEKQEKVLSLLTKEETSPTMMEEVYKLYREVFPYIFREEETLREIIGHDGNIRIEKRNDCQELIAVSLIRKNSILLLVVREDYRPFTVSGWRPQGSLHHLSQGKLALPPPSDLL